MQEQLILFPVDSLASPTQQQESDLAKKMIDTSGRRCLEQFGKFSQHGLWAKTFSALLIGMGDWYSKRCKLTWKLKGTKYNRMYFQLQVLTLPTEGIEFGLLLTPTTIERAEHPDQMRARAEKNGYKNGTKYNSLTSQVIFGGMLPTPRAQGEESYQTRAARKGHKVAMSYLEANVEYQVMNAMLPTPTADDNPAKNTGKRNQDGLQKRAFQMSGKTSQLNPRFVAEMMGFPPNYTELPFQNGETKA